MISYNKPEYLSNKIIKMNSGVPLKIKSSGTRFPRFKKKANDHETEKVQASCEDKKQK